MLGERTGLRPGRAVLALAAVVVAVFVAGMLLVNYFFQPGDTEWYMVEKYDPSAHEFTIAVQIPCSTRLTSVTAEWARNGDLDVRAELGNDGLVPWRVPAIGSRCPGRVPGHDYEWEVARVQLDEAMGSSVAGCSHLENPGCAWIPDEPPGGWPPVTRTVEPSADWRIE